MPITHLSSSALCFYNNCKTSLAIVGLSIVGVLASSPLVSAINVSSFSELSDAISDGEAEVVINNGFEFTSSLTINGSTKIIGGNNTISRSNSYSGGLFLIQSGASLEIENLIIDGGAPGWKMDYEHRFYTGENDSGYVRVPTTDGPEDIVANSSLIINSGTLKLNNSTIQNARLGRYAQNGATGVNGAAISGIGDNFLTNSRITHTGSYNDGGALYLKGGTLTISGCVFSDNVGGVGSTQSVSGGFARISNASISIEGTTFSNHFAQTNGGAIVASNSDIEIDNSSFKHNMVGNDGSALFFSSTSNTTTVKKSVFEENIGFATNIAPNGCQSLGTITDNVVGGVYKDLVFKKNTACGGAFASFNGREAVYENIEASENVASIGGGVFYNSIGGFTVKKLYAHDNKAMWGGVFDIGGRGFPSAQQITIEDSAIENNSGNYGGAIHLEPTGSGLYVSIRNSSILSNYATFNGGGIYHNGRLGGDLVLTGTVISGNSAGETGGGIYHKMLMTALATNKRSIAIDETSKIYNNSAEVAGDDFAYPSGRVCSRNAGDRPTSNNPCAVYIYERVDKEPMIHSTVITLPVASLMGVNGIDGWYYDNENDRFKDTDNPTTFDDLVNNIGESPLYLKAAGLHSANYNGNGGKTNAQTVTVKHGNSYVVDSDIPKRDGYIFNGWNTRADGSGIALSSGDTYDGADGYTLYAQWTKQAPSSISNVNPNTGDGIVRTTAILLLSLTGLAASILTLITAIKKRQ